MDVLLHSLSVGIIYIQKEINMPTLGLEAISFVSEEYCYHALTHSATSGCEKPFATSIRGSRASKPHASEN